MSEVPFALALGAGMLAAVNPCGFALLPAYLSFLVLGQQDRSRPRVVGRALMLTAAMTLGFVAVFGLFGLVVAPLGGSVQRYLPWFTIGLGLVVAVAGGWLLAGRQLPAPRLHRGTSSSGPVKSNLLSMVAFGTAYALASLGCTIGPFLAIVVTSFNAESGLAGIGLFVTYAAGMGLVVGIAAVAVALARTSVIGGLRRLGPAIARIGGGLVLVAGLYVAYYGWYELRIYRGQVGSYPVINAAAAVQHWLASAVERIGAVGLLGILAVLVVVAVASAVLVRGKGRRQPSDDTSVAGLGSDSVGVEHRDPTAAESE